MLNSVLFQSHSNNMKNYFVMAGIAVAASLLVLMFVPSKVTNLVPALGAVSSPDMNSPYFSFGGVRQWAGSTDNLNQATTTVCAIQSPAATSTLIMGSVRLTVSSSTASTVTLAKAATAYATTTALGSASVSAGAQATVVSLRTAAGGDALAETFSPNTWFVVGMAGGVGTFSPTGVCKAQWREN